MGASSDLGQPFRPKQKSWGLGCEENISYFSVLFNDALNTFLINGYIGVRNILIGKIPSGYMTGIDLRSTAWQIGAYTSEENGWSCYDIRAEAALPPSVTDIARVFWLAAKDLLYAPLHRPLLS